MRRRSPRGSVGALVGALAVCLAARDAEACKCPVRGTEISAPIVLAGTLQLIAEEVALRCDRAPLYYVACRWSARYRLRNPGDARRFDVAIRHVFGAAVTLALDATTVARTPARSDREQRRAADRDARQNEAEIHALWAAPSGGEVTLTVDATVQVAPWECTCIRSTNGRRHRWVSRKPGSEYLIDYRPGTDFSAAPSQFTATQDVPAAWDPGTRRSAVDGRVVTTEVRPRVMSAANSAGESFSVARPLRLSAGGPVVGVGLGWSPEGVRARVRAGWEVAWPRLLVHSLVVETDARRRVMLVPALELTFPEWYLLLPDLGVGLGAPIQLVPEARPGVRVHGRLGWWMFAVIGSFDHFPAARGLPRERLGSLLLQASF